jgi:hypothetical protein
VAIAKSHQGFTKEISTSPINMAVDDSRRPNFWTHKPLRLAVRISHWRLNGTTEPRNSFLAICYRSVVTSVLKLPSGWVFRKINPLPSWAKPSRQIQCHFLNEIRASLMWGRSGLGERGGAVTLNRSLCGRAWTSVKREFCVLLT